MPASTIASQTRLIADPRWVGASDGMVPTDRAAADRRASAPTSACPGGEGEAEGGGRGRSRSRHQPGVRRERRVVPRRLALDRPPRRTHRRRCPRGRRTGRPRCPAPASSAVNSATRPPTTAATAAGREVITGTSSTRNTSGTAKSSGSESGTAADEDADDRADLPVDPQQDGGPEVEGQLVVEAGGMWPASGLGICSPAVQRVMDTAYAWSVSR